MINKKNLTMERYETVGVFFFAIIKSARLRIRREKNLFHNFFEINYNSACSFVIFKIMMY